MESCLIVVDNSISGTATSLEQNLQELDHLQELNLIRVIIKDIKLRGNRNRISIMSSSSAPKIVEPFTQNESRLLQSLDTIQMKPGFNLINCLKIGFTHLKRVNTLVKRLIVFIRSLIENSDKEITAFAQTVLNERVDISIELICLNKGREIENTNTINLFLAAFQSRYLSFYQLMTTNIDPMIQELYTQGFFGGTVKLEQLGSNETEDLKHRLSEDQSIPQTYDEFEMKKGIILSLMDNNKELTADDKYEIECNIDYIVSNGIEYLKLKLKSKNVNENIKSFIRQVIKHFELTSNTNINTESKENPLEVYHIKLQSPAKEATKEDEHNKRIVSLLDSIKDMDYIDNLIAENEEKLAKMIFDDKIDQNVKTFIRHLLFERDITLKILNEYKKLPPNSHNRTDDSNTGQSSAHPDDDLEMAITLSLAENYKSNPQLIQKQESTNNNNSTEKTKNVKKKVKKFIEGTKDD